MIRRLRLRIREILAGDSAPDPGRAVAMATAEVERLGGFAGDAFATPLLQVGVLLSVFGYMLFVEPWLAIVGIVLFVPQMLLVPTMQNMINRRAAVRTRIVRGFGQSVTGDAKEDNGWPERAIDKIFAIRMAIYRLKAAMKATLNLLNHSSEIGVLLAGGMLVIQGETQIGTVVAFISGLQRLRRPWHDLITYYRQASDAGVKYRLLRSVLDA
jgi:ABC-type multidrug transport system fused ATPase/permease subunit